MKFAISSVIFLSFFFTTNAQSNNKFINDSLRNLRSCDSIIIWEKHRKLTMQDFRGKPDYNSPANAITSFNIYYLSSIDSPFTFYCYSCFYKNTSWIKKEISDSLTMIHEQGHFDLAEVYAKKMCHKLRGLSYNIATVDSIAYAIYIETYNEMNTMHDKYDFETKNLKKQIEWNRSISALLSK